MKEQLSKQVKKVTSSKLFLKIVSNDRFGKMATFALEAPSRLKSAKDYAFQALDVIVNGSTIPSLDPAVTGDDFIEVSKTERKTKSSTSSPNVDSRRVEEKSSSTDSVSESDQKILAGQMADRTSIAKMGGRDVFDKCFKFMAADNARAMGVYPFFRPLDFNNGPEAQIEGRKVIMLGSNNYLGLTTDPRVRSAAKEAIDKYGTSMTGSRLVNGSMRLHNEFEQKLATFFHKEAGLVFTTGYQVNLATISALLSNKKSVAVIDKDVHASIYDGVRLSIAAGARMARYKHNDAESLDKVLSEVDAGEGALVITDGVFSAQGEIADLPNIVQVAKKHKARIFVDDAHGYGVLGPQGRGTVAKFGLESDVDLIGGTFSKSGASIGGWLVGDRKVLDYIQHFAFSFLFAASAAPPCVAAAMASFDIMLEEPWRQEKLRENFTYMRNELQSLGFELGKTQTAVIPIYIRDDMKTVMMWKSLLDDYSVYVNPFITPGVPPKQQVLRTSYMATHERKHLDQALEAFEKAGKKFGII